MKSVCLILTLSGHLVPISKPFPSGDSCERAGFSMTDGQTVKGYACLPRSMVDGMPIYDCGIISDIDLTMPAGKCTFDVMGADGRVRNIGAPCDAQVPGTINMYGPEQRPPVPKYQDRLE